MKSTEMGGADNFNRVREGDDGRRQRLPDTGRVFISE
jgi:hypothetical protein